METSTQTPVKRKRITKKAIISTTNMIAHYDQQVEESNARYRRIKEICSQLTPREIAIAQIRAGIRVAELYSY